MNADLEMSVPGAEFLLRGFFFALFFRSAFDPRSSAA
jgi:hypothetical protein